MTNAMARYAEMIGEKEVCERFANRLTLSELKAARDNNEISYYRGAAGRVFYHPEDLAEYCKRKEFRCQKNDSGNTGATGSQPRTTRPTSTSAGTTESEELVVGHYEQKYSPKPRRD